MERKYFLVFLQLAGLCCFGAVSASDSLKPNFSAVRIDTRIVMTGKLDDPAWLKAIPIELVFEIEPG
ncbi:MAG: hypothetical protein IH594_15750, partial [Bacteroidales bacterium]|nr:hypothetical protein [Bacteroidales bacterium]